MEGEAELPADSILEFDRRLVLLLGDFPCFGLLFLLHNLS